MAEASTIIATQSQVGFIDGVLLGCGNGYERISCNKLMLLERLDWEVHFVDSTVVRANQHFSGAKGENQKRKLWD